MQWVRGEMNPDRALNRRVRGQPRFHGRTLCHLVGLSSENGCQCELDLLPKRAYLCISSEQRPLFPQPVPQKGGQGGAYPNVCASTSRRGYRDDDNGVQHLDCISFFQGPLPTLILNLSTLPQTSLDKPAFLLSVLQSMALKH